MNSSQMKCSLIKKFNTCVVLLSTIFTYSYSANAETLRLAVAANFFTPAKQLASEFEKSSQHTIKVTAGSTGKLYAQIVHGAPFDVFFSADQASVSKLIEKNYALADTRMSYAEGQLVLWSNQFKINSLSRLTDLQFNHLAIANPKLAPYGRASVEVLENLKLVEKTQSQWVRGENIAQTFQFISSGNADLGFVALSQLINNKNVQVKQYWSIPKNLYSPILQDMILLAKLAQNPAKKQAALEFLAFLHSEQAQNIIKQNGYTIP